jgi:hypothetical protein
MVGFGGDNPHNDLVSCMDHNLTSVSNNIIHYDVIIEPSDVLGFQLTRTNPHGSSNKSFADPIGYPKTLYLDRFLFDKFELVYHKKNTEQKMRQEIQELMRQRNTLTRHNVCPFDLQSFLDFIFLGSRYFVGFTLHTSLL